MNHLALKEKFKKELWGLVMRDEIREAWSRDDYHKIIDDFASEIAAREERLVEEIEKLPTVMKSASSERQYIINVIKSHE